MSSTFLLAWLRAFALTQTVELVVHAHAPGLDLPRRSRLAVGFGASAITHPLVWFVIPGAVALASPAASWWTAVWIAEGFAVTAEALWLAAFGVRLGPALLVSLFANGASFSMGLLCYQGLAW